MSKRILVVAQLPPPIHGSTVMAERFLNALHHNGFETGIVQKTFSRSMEEVGKASLAKVLRIPAHCFNLLKAIREFKPDICLYFVAVGITALVVDALLTGILVRHRIPYVLYFHGTGYRKYSLNPHGFHRYAAERTLQRALGGIVLGERLKADVNSYIPNERLFVLPNGIPDIDLKAERCKRGNRTVRVIFLSNLVKTKGLLELVQVAKAVTQRSKAVRFAIAGRVVDERFHQELLQYVKIEGLNDFVEILGPLYNKEKDAFFKSGDIFVFPTYKDTFPLVNLEAMQNGIPVISSDEGAIPEVVQDGVNGYIVDPRNISQLASKVLELVENPSLRERMGKAGRGLYEKNYSIEAYQKKVKEAIGFFANIAHSRPPCSNK